MKKHFVLTVLMIISFASFNIRAEIPGNTAKTSSANGEKIFLENADECLAIIEAEAREISIEGVAVIAFIPGEVTESWVSKMKVVGNISTDKYNLCAVAYCKASEMAITLKNSGNEDRSSIIGEFGYEGGIIRKVNSGYIVAAFSGGSSQQDADAGDEGSGGKPSQTPCLF